jgi:hypothetical protein
MPLPFMRANFGRGKTYACPACHRQPRTSKTNVAVVLAAFTLAWFASKEFDLLGVLVVLVALAVFEWLTVRVSLEE